MIHTTIALVIFLIGLAVIGTLWFIGHPAIIDRGEGLRVMPWHAAYWANPSKVGHLIGSFCVSVLTGFLSGSAFLGFLVSIALWSLVEVAQKNPRDHGAGYAQPGDFVTDTVGALLGAAMIHLFGSLL